MNTKSHPVFQQLLGMECSDKRAAPVAFAVYMDLAEGQALWDLQCLHCKELDIIYITGKENDSDSEPRVFIPVPASCNISPEWLLKIQNSMQTKTSCVTLAFKDADSTVVYYQVSDGLTAPDSPETVQSKKSSEEKKRFLRSEMWRKRSQLYESAKLNLDCQMLAKQNNVE